ncbi:hypothetical protein FOL47_000743 [Perkinsus chesapeaki]|uniref:Uncharacterized protein n=1 Tax=Perkinsus chesapeaki TaxID=330153 RepID=A0A7J6KWY5_PERCH|nr:hypothetical protein FOL47_000743 [Perkinsus chesapeaki]
MEERYEIGVFDKGDSNCVIWPPDAIALKKYYKMIVAASSMMPLITGNQIDAIALPDSKVCCLTLVLDRFLCVGVAFDEATGTTLVGQLEQFVRLALGGDGIDAGKLDWMINEKNVMSHMVKAMRLGAILRRVKLKTPVKIAGVSRLHALSIKESFVTSDACINLWSVMPEPCVKRFAGYPREGVTTVCVREADRLLAGEFPSDVTDDVAMSLVAIMEDSGIWSRESYSEVPELVPNLVPTEEKRLPSMIEIALHGYGLEGVVEDEDRVTSESWRWGRDISIDNVIHGGGHV